MSAPLPPFGLHLAANRSPSEVRLYFGDNHEDAWRLARFRGSAGLPVLLLPDDQCVDSYRWPVSGWDVLAMQIGYFQPGAIPVLALTLLNAGANIVRVVAAPDYRLVIYGGSHV